MTSLGSVIKPRSAVAAAVAQAARDTSVARA